MISPEQVLQEAAFNDSSSRSKTATPSKPPRRPQREEQAGLMSEDPLQSSYQHTSGLRAATVPNIHHYDQDGGGGNNDAQQQQQHSSRWFRGDPSWRPNTGETNVYDTAVLGLALHELLDYLRLANVCCGVASVLLAVVGWFFRLILLKWDKLVLSGYFAVLALALVGSEATSLWRVDWLDRELRDHFGILYHPPGKIVFGYLLATLAWSVQGVWETLLGCIYFVSASILLGVWVSYPEYQRLFRDEPRPRAAAPQRFNSWSYLSNSLSAFYKESDETTGLIASSLRQQHSNPL